MSRPDGGGPVLALDIGGTKLAVALIEGCSVRLKRTLPTPAAEGPDAVVSAAAAGAADLLAAWHGPAPVSVGVASAGVVEAGGKVRAMSPELLPGWHGFPLVDELSAALAVFMSTPRITAINDAQAAAYGEYVCGAGQGKGSLFFVTVSTGVGGGAVVGGSLWQGAGGLAGHVGHVRGGELERLTSGTALAERAAAQGHALDARGVIAAAQAGEAWAGRLLDEAADALAEALVDVKLLLDPEVFVLGGGVGLNPSFAAALERALAAKPLPLRPSVTSAALGADAGLIGAAAWALTQGAPMPYAGT